MESKKFFSLTLKSVTIGVILNIALSSFLNIFATKDQIKPPKGAAKLNFFDQLMHMFVHHAQVLGTSSLIVAIVVFLSMFFANLIKLS
jgi:hypothetical protein